MFCKHCGKEIPDISRFCRYCGKELDVQENAEEKKNDTIENLQNQPEIAVEEKPVSVDSGTPANGPKKKKTWLIIAIIASAVLALGIGIFAFVKLTNSNKFVGTWNENGGYGLVFAYDKDKRAAVYEDNSKYLYTYDYDEEKLYFYEDDGAPSVELYYAFNDDGSLTLFNEYQEYTLTKDKDSSIPTFIKYKKDFIEGNYLIEHLGNNIYYSFRKDGTYASYLDKYKIDGYYEINDGYMIFDGTDKKNLIEVYDDEMILYDVDSESHATIMKSADSSVIEDLEKSMEKKPEEKPDVKSDEFADKARYWFMDFSIEVPKSWDITTFESGSEDVSNYTLPYAIFSRDGKEVLVVNEGGIGYPGTVECEDCIMTALGESCRNRFDGVLDENNYYMINGYNTLIIQKTGDLTLEELQNVIYSIGEPHSKPDHLVEYAGDKECTLKKDGNSSECYYPDDNGAIGYVQLNGDSVVKIRVSPSTSSTQVGKATNQASFAYYKKATIGQYTWYCISPSYDMWIANDGKWLYER